MLAFLRLSAYDLMDELRHLVVGHEVIEQGLPVTAEVHAELLLVKLQCFVEYGLLIVRMLLNELHHPFIAVGEQDQAMDLLGEGPTGEAHIAKCFAYQSAYVHACK